MDSRLKVGNKCFLKAQGNEVRNHKDKPMEEWIYECEIIKVGRKYFIVKHNWREIKFNIDDLTQATEYCRDWEFHFERQGVFNKMKVEQLELALMRKFNGYGSTGLTLNQLERIMDIIEE